MASSKLEARRGRAVPREFNFHWGSGQIIEEAAYVGQYAEPAIQLLPRAIHLLRRETPLQRGWLLH